MITLTDQEREKFALYAAQEAASYQALVEQMEKLSVPKQLIMHNKVTSGAYLLVAEHLTKVEKQGI